MLGSFKKAIFRVLCLCCVLIGGGLMAEPNPEELVLLGIKSYEKQDFSKARKYFEKACGLNNGGGCNGLGVLYKMVKEWKKTQQKPLNSVLKHAI